MKKFFYSMVTMLTIAATTVVFTSCSDDEDTIIVMSLGIDSMTYLGSDSEEEKELWQYISQVESAYKSALGMDDDNTLVLKNVDYSSTCTEMKRKFDSTTLPTPPSISVGYSFRYKLTTTSSGKEEIVATKIFANE